MSDSFPNLREQAPQEQETELDEDDDEEEDAHPPALALVRRRNAIFGESHDPAAEDQDERRAVVVHPKSDAQRARIVDAVKNEIPFISLDTEQMNAVIDAMFERPVKQGEYVTRQGENGEFFYVIDTGIYKVYVQEEHEHESAPHAINSYNNSGAFGELALMSNTLREETIQAETNGLLWVIDRQTFQRIVQNIEFKKLQKYERLLESVPILSMLTDDERSRLDAFVQRSYKDGAVIFHQGDHSDGMYFVEDGTVIFKRSEISGGQEQGLASTRITNGGYFGELALLTKQPCAATIAAVGDVKCVFVDVESFERLVGPCVEIMKRNTRQEYDRQLVQLFGSKTNFINVRCK